jgi:transposase
LLTGAHYLVLKNADKLDESETQRLQRLLDENANLNTLYILKEQPQALWESETVELMQERLEAWCRIADQSTILCLKTRCSILRSDIHPQDRRRVSAKHYFLCYQ